MNDTERSYRAAVRYARRHISDCCYGRPCLEDCLRRLGASLPPCACAGGWRPPRWAKWLALAAVLAVVLFAALHSNAADVQCIWNGSTYVCSGTGSSIEVIGGGSGEPVVVTNFWGVCTNCVAMSPGDCESLKSSIEAELTLALQDILLVSSNARTVYLSVTNMEADISTFRRFGHVGNSTEVREVWPEVENYFNTVSNTQSSLVKSFWLNSAGNTYSKSNAIGFNDGIYDYAQSLTFPLSSQREYLASAISSADQVERRIDDLRANVEDNLVCDECQPEYVPGDSPGGGSGGGSGTGRWCTEEQGTAIIELLRELQVWADRQHAQLSSISNYVRASYDTLRSGLYSDYTAIPRGENWQDLYLNGQPTAWGYDPTNIIQRIEVLLYGISGISTNTASLEDTTPSAEDTVDDVSDAAASISTDADGTAATTLGNAVLDFFRAFTPRTKNYQGGEEIIAEVSIKVGDETHYVPAMRLGESGFLLDTMTAVKSCVNGFCSVLFWVGGAFVIFRFWAWFAAWCVKLSKWAVELCTSLFAS